MIRPGCSTTKTRLVSPGGDVITTGLVNRRLPNADSSALAGSAGRRSDGLAERGANGIWEFAESTPRPIKKDRTRNIRRKLPSFCRRRNQPRSHASPNLKRTKSEVAARPVVTNVNTACVNQVFRSRTPSSKTLMYPLFKSRLATLQAVALGTLALASSLSAQGEVSGTFDLSAWSLDLDIPSPDWDQADIFSGGDVTVPDLLWLADAGIPVTGTFAQDYLALDPTGDVPVGAVLAGFSFTSSLPPGPVTYHEFSAFRYPPPRRFNRWTCNPPRCKREAVSRSASRSPATVPTMC